MYHLHNLKANILTFFSSMSFIICENNLLNRPPKLQCRNINLVYNKQESIFINSKRKSICHSSHSKILCSSSKLQTSHILINESVAFEWRWDYAECEMGWITDLMLGWSDYWHLSMDCLHTSTSLDISD